VFFILHTAFFGLHYLFASQTAHIGALYAAFLAMMLAAGKREKMQKVHHDGKRECHRRRNYHMHGYGLGQFSPQPSQEV
jgi:hypothetical protein